MGGSEKNNFEDSRANLKMQFEEIELEGRTKKCQRCGRLFHYSGFGHIYCDICKKADERDFEKVKEYIYEHEGATMIEVSEETGVYLKHIQNFLKEGRLEIPKNSNIFINCEMCKGPIRYGRLCPNCADKLTKAMREEMNFDDYQIGEVPKIIGKMRFLDKK